MARKASARSLRAQAAHLPRRPVALPAGAFEAAKLIAVILMAVNHICLALPDPWRHWGYYAGRPCVALFSCILLARLMDNSRRGGEERALLRLLIWGLIAQPIYSLLERDLGIRADVLLNLALGVGLIWLWRRGLQAVAAAAVLTIGAAGAFGGAGAYLDGGVALPLAMLGAAIVWPRSRAGAAGVIIAASVLHNYLAEPALWIAPVAVLAAAPILWLSPRLAKWAPRLPTHAFYGFYPAHLGLILAVF